jgi:hypothetical protein
VSLVPPYRLLGAWIASHQVPGTECLRCPYDDVIDILRAFVTLVPVDEAWYTTEYSQVSAHVAATGETATQHFRKHGYFEHRLPFASGWRGLVPPDTFATVQKALAPAPVRGRLLVRIDLPVLLGIVRSALRFVHVDEAWYSAAYPWTLDGGRFPTARSHYINSGYFEDCLPASVRVDEAWYLARYAHVRNGLADGSASSAKDHFMRIGYGEGCQPAPP